MAATNAPSNPVIAATSFHVCARISDSIDVRRESSETNLWSVEVSLWSIEANLWSIGSQLQRGSPQCEASVECSQLEHGPRVTNSPPSARWVIEQHTACRLLPRRTPLPACDAVASALLLLPRAPSLSSINSRGRCGEPCAGSERATSVTRRCDTNVGGVGSASAAIEPTVGGVTCLSSGTHEGLHVRCIGE